MSNFEQFSRSLRVQLEALSKSKNIDDILDRALDAIEVFISNKIGRLVVPDDMQEEKISTLRNTIKNFIENKNPEHNHKNTKNIAIDNSIKGEITKFIKESFKYLVERNNLPKDKDVSEVSYQTEIGKIIVGYFGSETDRRDEIKNFSHHICQSIKTAALENIYNIKQNIR